MGLQDFEGDALFIDTPDGGDFVITDGLITPDLKFSTAAYLSLFGGNKEDSGKIKKYEWWGNKLKGLNENEKLVSRFQHIILGLPLTVKNIREAEAAAKMDLKWFIDEKIVDEIKVSGRATGGKNFILEVQMMKDSNTIFNSSYMLLWGVENGGV